MDIKKAQSEIKATEKRIKAIETKGTKKVQAAENRLAKAQAVAQQKRAAAAAAIAAYEEKYGPYKPN